MEPRIGMPRETLAKVPLDPNQRHGFARRKGDAPQLTRAFELVHCISEGLGAGMSCPNHCKTNTIMTATHRNCEILY